MKIKERKTKKILCSCGKEKEISFENDGIVEYPIFSCPEHGPDKRNEWALWWNIYKDRWKELHFWDNPADKLSCLVGYFCHTYQKFYNRPFVFSYANPNPYKDKDFVMARRILLMFKGNAREAKIYIRWVFQKRIRIPSYAVHSLGFFASQKFVNEYFQAKERSLILKRSSALPKDFLNWCRKSCPEIFEKQELETWNDLNGLVTHIISYGNNNIEGFVIKEAVQRGMLDSETTYKKLEG